MEQTKAPRCLIDFMVRSGGRNDELIIPMKVRTTISSKNLNPQLFSKRVAKQYMRKRHIIAKLPVVVASFPWKWM